MVDDARVQHAVAAVWRSVLDSAEPAADDDFFLLGGNSLTALTFVVDIEAALRIQFPLHALFVDGRFAAVVNECAARCRAPVGG